MGSMIKGVYRNLAKFTGKHLCQSLFFYKVTGLKSVLMTIFKTDAFKNFVFQLICFPMNNAKFLGTAIFIEHLR